MNDDLPNKTRRKIRFHNLCEWLPGRGIDAVVQVGLGQGLEVPQLRDAIGNVPFIAFEPLSCFTDKASSYPGMVVRSAVSDKCGVATIWKRRGRIQASSMFSRVNKPKDQPVLTPMTTLDNYFSETLPGKSILLWMDCEGAELKVVNGAANFLSSVKMIVTEVSEIPDERRPGWVRRSDLIDKLNTFGFRVLFNVFRVGDVLAKAS